MSHHVSGQDSGGAQQILTEVDVESSGVLLPSPADPGGQERRDRLQVGHAYRRGRHTCLCHRLRNRRDLAGVQRRTARAVDTVRTVDLTDREKMFDIC